MVKLLILQLNLSNPSEEDGVSPVGLETLILESDSSLMDGSTGQSVCVYVCVKVCFPTK